jgi:hypothetical protein
MTVHAYTEHQLVEQPAIGLFAALLDLVGNFTLFSEHKAGLVKILGQTLWCRSGTAWSPISRRPSKSAPNG